MVDGLLKVLQEYCYLILEVPGVGWTNGREICGVLLGYLHRQETMKQTRLSSLDTWLLGFWERYVYFSHVVLISSLLHMKRQKLSLLISMNGSLVSLYRSAENVVSMSPRYSPPTPLSSDDTSAQVPSTFTTTYNTLMSTTKPASEASIIVTALNVLPRTLPTSSPPSVISLPTRASIY
jgi:hypothetical protein